MHWIIVKCRVYFNNLDTNITGIINDSQIKAETYYYQIIVIICIYNYILWSRGSAVGIVTG
jgi:hypothetical protein